MFSYPMIRLFCRLMEYAESHKKLLFGSIHRRESKLSLKLLAEKEQNTPAGSSSSSSSSVSEEKGVLFREIYSLVEAIVPSLDFKGIVIGAGCVADQCHNVVVFFKQALETIKSAKLDMTQQRELKNSHLQSYCLSLLIPTLTVLFNHVGFRDVSRLLMQGPVLNHCRDIFQCLILMATGVTPVFVGT